MNKLHVGIRSNRSARATYSFSLLACLCLLLAVTLSAQAPESGGKTGIVRQLADVKFPPGDGPDCLQFFLENGDMKIGPSTAVMKAAPKCVVPPHYHTAEEQLLTRYLASFLFGVSPVDPSTFVAVSLALSAVALLASYVPARRAMRVDPIIALRYE